MCYKGYMINRLRPSEYNDYILFDEECVAGAVEIIAKGIGANMLLQPNNDRLMVIGGTAEWPLCSKGCISTPCTRRLA